MNLNSNKNSRKFLGNLKSNFTPKSKRSNSRLFFDEYIIKMPKSKRSQAWGMDIIIAVMIFSIGIIVFLIYTFNQSTDSKEKLEQLSYEGEAIFKMILSQGYPDDWDIGNAVKIGLLSNDRINETKLERFYNFAQSDYDKTRSLFNTGYHYFFYFDNMTINSVQVSGIGKPGADISEIKDDSTNLIKITRFVIYKEKPTTVYLYVWEE